MSERQIRCCLLGAQERDLYVLGEVHRQATVDIAFIYDPDPSAVGMEIAEILGLERLSEIDALRERGDIDYVIVPEPREQYAEALEALSGSAGRVVSQPEALEILCPRRPRGADDRRGARDERASNEAYSVDDALRAFERLFDREKLLEFLLDVAVRAAGADAGSVMLYSEEAEELYIVYATGLSERVVRNTRQRLGDGIAGIVAQERKGRFIREAPGWTVPGSQRERPDVDSAVSVPLVFEDRLLGVLNVSSASELRPDALTALERLSVRMARLLNESLKLQETRIRHQDMNLRQSVGELSERAIPTGAKFAVISNYLADLVGAAAVEVFVGTHEGDWLVLGGSNRRLSSHPEIVRADRGALARAYLERRSVILTESARDAGETATSVVFTPLELGSTLGVLMLEFAERHRLDEFLAIRGSVALELSRFIASERREWRLRHELEALARLSDAAPALLSCRTLDDLCEFLARMVCGVLECERVSVRLLGPDGGKQSRYEDAMRRRPRWPEEDEERFLKLKKAGEAYSLAFLDYPDDGDAVPGYHSVIAVPIDVDGVFSGGIIAYDRRTASVLDEATFTDVDRTVLEQVATIAASMIRTLRTVPGGEPSADASAQGEPVPYHAVLAGNMQRLRRVIDTEMSRADRYHHSFSVLVLIVRPLAGMFDRDHREALALVEEMTRGIQTRTRKSDFGAWIRHDTFAMLSLEGGRRVKFLVARLRAYLAKDFEAATGFPLEQHDLLIGQAAYPGGARTPEALVAEAESSARPAGDE